MRCRSAPSRSLPRRAAARVLALLATMWILPGLVGPPVGALVASTIGWRWAFVVPLPVLVATWALIAPVLDLVPRPERSGPGLSLRWPVQLMIGAGFVFASLTVVAWWVPVAVLAGLAIGVPALRHRPSRHVHGAPGSAGDGGGAFLLSTSFLAMDAFLTLMLTRLRGLSLGTAGLVITVASITWAAGALWQSNRAGHRPLSRLVAIGTVLLLTGQAVASTLWIQVPLIVAYVGWGVVGLGMGIAFATIPLAAMRVSASGEEARLSSVLLMDMLGVATGAGLGGAAIAASDALGAPLRSGIAWAFALALVVAAALLAIAHRIPSGRAEERRAVRAAEIPIDEPARTPRGAVAGGRARGAVAGVRRDGPRRRGRRVRLDLGGRPPALPRQRRPERGPWEVWTTLAGLAAATERVELGPLVACAGFHAPAMLAKQAATVHEISGGRLVLALGAGWNEPEFRAFGFPFDHRASRFEESFEVIRRLISGDRVTFEAAMCRSTTPCCCPARPPPKLMVGSTGSRVLAAALPHVDAWNTWFDWFGNTPGGFAARNARSTTWLGEPVATPTHSSGAPASWWRSTRRPGAAARSVR